jgi:hypothetical protein
MNRMVYARGKSGVDSTLFCGLLLQSQRDKAFAFYPIVTPEI